MKKWLSELGYGGLLILVNWWWIYPTWNNPGFIWVIFQFIGMFVVARFFIRYFILDPLKKRKEKREREFNEYFRGGKVI